MLLRFTRTLLLAVMLPVALIPDKAALAVDLVPFDSVKLQDLTLTIPNGWLLAQEATTVNTVVAGFQNEAESRYLLVFARHSDGRDLRSMFGHGVTVLKPWRQQRFGENEWQIISTRKMGASSQAVYATGFYREQKGVSYYGYSRAESQAAAEATAETFLMAIQ